MKKTILFLVVLTVSVAIFPVRASSLSKNDSLYFAPYQNISSEAKKECENQVAYVRNGIADKKQFQKNGHWKTPADRQFAIERDRELSRKITIQFVSSIPSMNREIPMNDSSYGAMASIRDYRHFYINPDSVEKYCDAVFMTASIVVSSIGLLYEEIVALEKGYIKEKGKPSISVEQLYCMQWQFRYVLEEKLRLWKPGQPFTMDLYREVLKRQNEMASGALEYFKRMNPKFLCQSFSKM